MQAALYRLHSCLLDDENTVHILLVDEEKKTFKVFYLDSNVYYNLIEMFDGRREDNQFYHYHWQFLSDCWAKMGFAPHSLAVDEVDGSMVPIITFRQSIPDNKSVFLTTFIPIGDAVIACKFLNMPIFLTERCERNIKGYKVSELQQYVVNVAKRREQ